MPPKKCHTATVVIPSATVPFTILHISDTHNFLFKNLPPADVLIHSGDFLNNGIRHGPAEMEAFVAYLTTLVKFPLKIIVPGNHEMDCDKLSYSELEKMINPTCDPSILLLIDSGITYKGVAIYGTPWNNVQNADNGFAISDEKRMVKFSQIPLDTNILVTHVPPYKILDLSGVRHGCKILREAVMARKISLHCFGHVHGDVGVVAADKIRTFSNAAMDVSKRPNIIRVTPSSLSAIESVSDSIVEPAVAKRGAD